jgi:hypothetical protein
MSDEPAKFILGDTAISAFERTGGKRRSGREEETGPSLTHCENCGAELKGTLVREMRASQLSSTAALSGTLSRSTKRVPELGFKIFHDHRASHRKAVAPNE